MTQYHDSVVDRRRHPFFMVDNEIIETYAARLGPYACVIYFALVKYAGRDESCYPTVSTLQKKTGFSKNSVLKAIKTLEENKLISVEKRVDGNGSHLSNVYILLPLPCHDEQNWGGSPQEPPIPQKHGGSSLRERGAVRHENEGGSPEGREVVHSANPTYIESNKDSNTNTTTTKPAPKFCEILEADVVVFNPDSIPEIPESPQSPPGDSEEASQGIVTALIEKGITPAKAQVLTRNHDPALIQKQINALPHRKATDPAATLIRSIEQDWSVPQKMADEVLEGKKQAKKRDKETESRRQREIGLVRKQALEKAWEELDEAKKGDIEQKAREIIQAQPMGTRLLEGVLGAALIKAKCLDWDWR